MSPAKTVVEEGGDYLFVVRDNERNFKADIELFMQNEGLEGYCKTEENDGRMAYVSPDIECVD